MVDIETGDAFFPEVIKDFRNALLEIEHRLNKSTWFDDHNLINYKQLDDKTKVYIAMEIVKLWRAQ